ncbi:serine/threonine-protein kinase, partial [Pseudactinotalea suaedae]
PSDFSLTATLYSLLEGRSPHEVPGGPNTAAHLTGRIASGFIGAMKRPDLPASLRDMLRRGLSHDRAARYDSAADMGRALQDIQRELGFEVTPLEVPRGSAPARPPEPTTRVLQSQPIQLPEGHATLAPVGDGGAQVAAPVQEGGAHPGMSGTHPGTGAPPAHVAAGQVGNAGWSASRPHVASGAQPAVAAPAAPSTAPRTRPSWKLAYVGFVVVLVLACVVVASLLIAQANAGPSYDGRAVEHLDWRLTSTGVYEVEIPEGLAVPGEVEALTVATGDGATLEGTVFAEISTDSSEWLDGETVLLNPRESANLDGATTLDAEELAATLGLEVGAMHSGDVILVAAPYGYFSNTHPDVGIKVSEATLVIITITDAY